MTIESVDKDRHSRELRAKAATIAKAADLLHSAAERTAPVEGEDNEVRALRLRGAAILAHSAALEIAIAAGWLDAHGSGGTL